MLSIYMPSLSTTSISLAKRRCRMMSSDASVIPIALGEGGWEEAGGEAYGWCIGGQRQGAHGMEEKE